MKKTTVVFDLDGTLLDTLDDLKNSVNYALEMTGNNRWKEKEKTRRETGLSVSKKYF